MEWSIADVLQIIGLLITFLVAVGGWIKNSSERDKLEAETAALYANISADGAKREKQYKKDNEKLEQEIDELRKTIALHQDEIVDLKDIIEKKDARIHELETLTEKQEKEITRLRAELDGLLSRRKSNV